MGRGDQVGSKLGEKGGILDKIEKTKKSNTNFTEPKKQREK
jgi:hypothetical protein